MSRPAEARRPCILRLRVQGRGGQERAGRADSGCRDCPLVPDGHHNKGAWRGLSCLFPTLEGRLAMGGLQQQGALLGQKPRRWERVQLCPGAPGQASPQRGPLPNRFWKNHMCRECDGGDGGHTGDTDSRSVQPRRLQRPAERGQQSWRPASSLQPPTSAGWMQRRAGSSGRPAAPSHHVLGHRPHPTREGKKGRRFAVAGTRLSLAEPSGICRR